MPVFKHWRLEEREPDNEDDLLISQEKKPVSRLLCLQCDNETEAEYKCKSKECILGRYCSDSCRDKDMPFHKKVCGQLEKTESRPPGHRQFRAWLFPHDSEKPQATWLYAEYNQEDGKLRFKFDQPSVLAWSRGRDKIDGWASPYCRQATSRNYPLGHGILVVGLSGLKKSKTTAADVNRSINALGPKPGHVQPETGIVFLVGYEASGNLSDAKRSRLITPRPHHDFCHFIDVDLRDLQRGVDCIRHAANYPVTSGVTTRQGFPTIPALKINRMACPWNRALGITNPVEKIVCHANVHLIEIPVAKAFQMGLRWMIRAVPMPLNLQEMPTWSCIDYDFPSLFEHVVSGVGGSIQTLRVWSSFTVSNHNMAPIEPLHLKAVCEYVDKAEAKGEVLDRAGLEEYWQEYVRARAKEGVVIKLGSPLYLEDLYAREMDGGTLWVEALLKRLQPIRE